MARSGRNPDRRVKTSRGRTASSTRRRVSALTSGLPASTRDTVACDNGEKLKIIKIVLTIAHLDHTPENCADDNLRAWCQRHHLAYDAEHHKVTAWRTRRANTPTPDMFEQAA